MFHIEFSRAILRPPIQTILRLPECADVRAVAYPTRRKMIDGVGQRLAPGIRGEARNACREALFQTDLK